MSRDSYFLTLSHRFLTCLSSLISRGDSAKLVDSVHFNVWDCRSTVLLCDLYATLIFHSRCFYFHFFREDVSDLIFRLCLNLRFVDIIRSKHVTTHISISWCLGGFDATKRATFSSCPRSRTRPMSGYHRSRQVLELILLIDLAILSPSICPKTTKTKTVALKCVIYHATE